MFLDRHEIVLTNYETARDCPSIRAKRWFRIVLDEAHAIRNPDAEKTKKILALKVCCRLCLTGTPVMNCEQDLVTLLQFLGADKAYARTHITPVQLKSLL